MDLAYSKDHIDTFVIVSGDSDFSPLVSKLKELGKHVIGLGLRRLTSDLLRDNCDEFIYYEDLGQHPAAAPASALRAAGERSGRRSPCCSIRSWPCGARTRKSSGRRMVKDTMKRKKPSFNETYHGYRTFSELLEDAQTAGLLELETDARSRTYVVTRFGTEMQGPPRERSVMDQGPRPRIDRVIAVGGRRGRCRLRKSPSASNHGMKTWMTKDSQAMQEAI